MICTQMLEIGKWTIKFYFNGEPHLSIIFGWSIFGFMTGKAVSSL